MNLFQEGNGANVDRNPALVRFSASGLIGLNYDSDYITDNDVESVIVDPTTGSTLATYVYSAGESIFDEQGFSTSAAAGLGRIATYWTNATDVDVDGELLQVRRYSISDGAADTVFGDELVDYMYGGVGQDTFYGGLNDDSLFGENDNDQLIGQDGNDWLDGGAGNDFMQGGAGGDMLYGNTGTGDLADYTDSPSAVTINLLTGAASGGYAAGDTFSGVEYLRGSIWNDSLTGDAGNNTLFGSFGNDNLNGGAGNDVLQGDDGDDILVGRAGGDALRR